MKKYVVIFSLLSSTFTFAANGISDGKPCQSLATLCQTAGFSENGQPGKNTWANCVGPLLNQQPVPNVKASPDQILICQKEIQEMPCTKVASACRQGGYTGGAKKLTLFDCMLPLIQGTPVAGVNPSSNDVIACKAMMEKEILQKPCFRVMLACKNAGYSPDDVNGQLFVRNCYLPLLNGQSVAGAVVDANAVAACKAETNKRGTLTSQTTP